jgi:hypothetical protein
VICLADAINKTNIIPWSFVKCKRVTRSVLTAELYEMTHEFNINIVIKATLERMLETNISLILCTNSKSLYDCLVRLETTQEKRLIIDVMRLRQSYERREMTKIRWIHEHNNLADSITKTKTSSALKMMIDINIINLDIIEWVKRTINRINQKQKNRSD